MKRIIFALLSFVLIGLASCKKDPYLLYNSGALLQFGPNPSLLYRSGYELNDTTKSFTFVYEDDSVKQDTVFFDIYAIGGPTKADRSFTLQQVQVNGLNNAVPDVHYVSFSNPSSEKNFIIKADSVHAAVPIILLRDPSLKDTSVALQFQVSANENFQLGDSMLLWRRVSFTDELSQPDAWTALFSQYYLGAYSKVKHQFMITATGQKWDDDFINQITQVFAEFQYWIGVAKSALIDYNNAHPSNPLRDEHGELVVFP